MVIDVSPNPTSKNLYVSFSSPLPSEVTLNIFSINGTLVKTVVHKKITTTLTIDISSLSPGLYLLHINSPLGRSSHKLIIE